MDFKGELILALFLNVALKMLTFAFSTYLTRLLLPEHSGIGFSYMIYMDTVLFIGREAVRNGASRVVLKDKTEDGDRRDTYSAAAVHHAVNLSMLSVPLVIVAMLGFEVGQGILGVHMLPRLWPLTRRGVPPMDRVGVSGVLFPILPELTIWLTVAVTTLVEPCVMLVQSQDLFRVVVLAEFATLFGRLLTTIGFVRLAGISSEWDARLAFALGYGVYGALHVTYYLLVCSGSPFSRWLGGCASIQELRRTALAFSASPLTRALPFPLCVVSLRGILDARLRSWAVLRPFFRESLVRVALTEGEGMALTALSSTTTQGYYQLVSSLGSLVARLVFRLWENACFVRWSRDIAAGELPRAVELLTLMIRLAFYLGFALALVGPPSAQLFLTVLYSTRWSTPANVRALQLYCYALPWMAANGLIEAFLRSMASPVRLRQLERAMLAQSVLYIGACCLLLHRDNQQSAASGHAAGAVVARLVIANTVTMMWRSAYALYMIHLPEKDEGVSTSASKHVPLRDLRGAWIGWPMSLILAALFAVSRAVTPSVPVMAGIGSLYVGVVLLADRAIFRMTQRLIRRHG